MAAVWWPLRISLYNNSSITRLMHVESISSVGLLISECEYLRHNINFSDYAQTVSHKFHLDFKKSWITRIGSKLVPDVATSVRQKSNAGAVQRKCYEFEFLN